MHQKVEIFLQWAIIGSNMDSTKTDLNFFCSKQALHLVTSIVRDYWWWLVWLPANCSHWCAVSWKTFKLWLHWKGYLRYNSHYCYNRPLIRTFLFFICFFGDFLVQSWAVLRITSGQFDNITLNIRIEKQR